MALTIEDLAAYCRIDLPEPGDSARAKTEAELESLRLSAEEYLAEAGVALLPELKPRQEHVIKALVLHWVDNPSGGEIPAGLQRMINQLKHT